MQRTDGTLRDCFGRLLYGSTQIVQVLKSLTTMQTVFHILVRYPGGYFPNIWVEVCGALLEAINYIVREDLVSDQLENLSIEIIKPRSKPFIVATWYRPPNSPFELFSTFEDFVGKLVADGRASITSWVISTVIYFQRLFITLILRLC